MFIVDILVTALFFFALPVLIIRSLSDNIKKHFTALIVVNFFLFKALFYFCLPLIGIEYLGGIGGIVWSCLAYLYLKKQFTTTQENLPVSPTESINQNEDS